MDFSEIGLSPELLQAVFDAGYTNPTPIQQKAIPVVASGRDVLGCAQTGTGKTASFALPMIDKLAAGRARARMPRSLILEPTRELATQVEAAFEIYGKHHRLIMALLIGGERFADQERKLDRGVDVLIATPGRLLDLFERGKILLSDVRILVIDEADRMLDMGFIPDVERIVGLLPKNRQTLFFSATMPPEIRRLADAFLNDPVEIAVAPPASPAATVEQALVVVEPRDKREALRRLIASEDVKNALIFCNRKRDVDILYRSLSRHGFDAAALHGDMPQPKRTETLERFKNGEIRLLVASDVAARGLDIQGLSHVFNFDVPLPRRGLCPPHRPHRPRRPDGPLVHAGGAGGRQAGRGDREADRQGRSRSRRSPTWRRAELDAADEPSAAAAAAQRPERAAIAGAAAMRGSSAARGGDRRSRAGAASRGRRRRGRRRGQCRGVSSARRTGRRPPRRRDPAPADEPRVVGFGDHLPAFLARPLKIAARA